MKFYKCKVDEDVEIKRLAFRIKLSRKCKRFQNLDNTILNPRVQSKMQKFEGA